MTFKYAMALYELMQLRAGLDRCVERFDVERFRDLLGLSPGKLTRGPDVAPVNSHKSGLTCKPDALYRFKRQAIPVEMKKHRAG